MKSLLLCLVLFAATCHALVGHASFPGQSGADAVPLHRTQYFVKSHEFYERCVQTRCIDIYADRVDDNGTLSVRDRHGLDQCILGCSQRAIDAHIVLPDAPLITCYRRGQPCTLTSQCANGDDGYYACALPPMCPFCTTKVCSLGGTQSWTPGVCEMRGYLCQNPPTGSYPAYNCGQATDGFGSCGVLPTPNSGASIPGNMCLKCTACTA